LEKNLADLEAEVEASSKDLVLLERDYSALETAANIVLDPSMDKDRKMKELIDSIEDVRVELGNLKTNWYGAPHYESSRYDRLGWKVLPKKWYKNLYIKHYLFRDIGFSVEQILSWNL
jgi:hypothetical protein